MGSSSYISLLTSASPSATQALPKSVELLRRSAGYLWLATPLVRVARTWLRATPCLASCRFPSPAFILPLHLGNQSARGESVEPFPGLNYETGPHGVTVKSSDLLYVPVNRDRRTHQMRSDGSSSRAVRGALCASGFINGWRSDTALLFIL